MADAIEIDGKLFQERLAHLLTAWKNDKRSGDALFGGVASLVVMMGKVEDVPAFNKTNAIHVCLPFAFFLSPLVELSHLAASGRVALQGAALDRTEHIASLSN